MPKPKTSFIKILNPSGQAYTTLKRALLMVSAGKAKWNGNSIQLTEDWKKACALGALTNYIKAYRLRTMDEAGYDAVNTMTLDQLQGLPLAGPAIKLISKGKAHFTPRAPHCKTL